MTTDQMLRQALQTEKASFFAQHRDLPDEHRQRLWEDRIHQLDGQIPVDDRKYLSVSDPNAMARPQTLSDTGTRMGRRISVQLVPGAPRLSAPNIQLSRSAPSRLQHRKSRSSTERFSKSQQRKDDFRHGFPHFDTQNDTGYLDPLNQFGMAGAALQDVAPTFESIFDDNLMDQAHFGRHSTNPLNSTDYQAITYPSHGPTDVWMDLSLGTQSTSTPTTSGMSSHLAGSTLASDVSRHASPVSSTSVQGAVNDMVFDSSLSNVSSFPRVESSGDVPLSFPYPSFVAAHDSVMPLMQSNSSHFVDNNFPFLGEDALSLSTFPSPVADWPLGGPVFVVEDLGEPREGSEATDKYNDARVHQWRQDAAANRSRRLAPKTNDFDVVVTRAPVPLDSDDVHTHDKQPKLAISQTQYIRPKYPKKYCDQCDEHPSGFRGEHELRRHVDRLHKPVRKMWKCVEIDESSKFLANCKKCRSGKLYGAYYNAACHLRRAHFNKRQRGRKSEKPTERRGGTGGGDWPAMEELKKNWMIEVEHVPDNSKSASPSTPSSDGDYEMEDKPGTLELLPAESFDFESPQMSDHMNGLSSSPAHDMSSYSSRQSHDQGQMTQSIGGSSYQWLNERPCDIDATNLRYREEYDNFHQTSLVLGRPFFVHGLDECTRSFALNPQYFPFHQ